MEPKVTIKLDKDDYYYENEAITGQVRLKLARDLNNMVIKLVLKYEENYVLFNEDGDTALQSKQMKRKLVQHTMEGSESYQAGEHHIQFGIRMPTKIENGTFYHAYDSLSARMTYKLEAKLIEKQANYNRNNYMRGDEDEDRLK